MQRTPSSIQYVIKRWIEYTNLAPNALDELLSPKAACSNQGAEFSEMIAVMLNIYSENTNPSRSRWHHAMHGVNGTGRFDLVRRNFGGRLGLCWSAKMPATSAWTC
jgi:hypothetical protein